MTRKLLLALLLFLLVGCQRTRLPEDKPNPDGSIAFRLQTENAEIESTNVQTKGTPHNSLEKYDSVNVVVYSHTSDYYNSIDLQFFRTLTLNQDGSEWKYTPSMFWPAGKKLSLLAYASDIPYTGAGIEFSPAQGPPDYIKYRVPFDVTKQPDLLVSTIFNQPKVGNILMTMKHALACVSFCGIAPESDSYVKSITLRNVYGEGTLDLDDPAMKWQLNPDSKNLHFYEPGIDPNLELGEDPLPDNDYLMTEDGYLMMLPQELKDAVIDVLYWNGKDDTENKVITYILPIDDPYPSTWEPGKRYIYKFGTQSDKDITVVYYERYAANEYGLYYNDDGKPKTTIKNDRAILEAGYGVLSKKDVGLNAAAIRLNSPASTPVTSGTVVKLADDLFLFPVNQTGAAGSTFVLPTTTTPVDVYFSGSDKPCGSILPNFARGVYTAKVPIPKHDIRTPQQMRNITAITTSVKRLTNTYTQELDLDFSKAGIGGGHLTTAVVNNTFNDKFEGNNMRIENVEMVASENGALFRYNSGEIKEVVLLNSSIQASAQTAGIVAINQPTGVINLSRVIGELSGKPFTITGTTGYTGAIAGFNYGEIIGDQTIETATEIPIAEVSGWVSITGSSAGTGGVTGQNEGTITTCLVNGVYVKGSTVQPAQITIVGDQYVGGITGVNKARIDGNFSAENGAEPDVAGMVSITSSGSWVGGIAGINQGADAVLNEVNVRLGRGDASAAMIITGAESVGGIVGANEQGGTLKADRNSFISVRGNIRIKGTNMVGGIVGNNQSGNISNCFVYNFFSQTSPLKHYAPKISGELNVGGIVGYAGISATITNCAAFSTVSAANASANEDITNAVLEIKSTTNAAGGIVGRSFSELTLTDSYVLGNVNIHADQNHAGGIVGDNNLGTKIAKVHIGNSGAEVMNVYQNLFYAVKLPVKDERMKTGQGVMTNTSGTPTITGKDYIGGICGLNSGEIDGIEMNDNVMIGTATSNYVGGITGGNIVDAVVRNCKTYNPLSGGVVRVEGYMQVGGIIGLNNGIVERCQVGLAGMGKSNSITIKGAGTLGGIAGSTGGSGASDMTGNERTRLTDCNVYGKVRVEGQGWHVGGIIGLNQPTSKVINCNVIGYRSSYTNDNTYNYDVTVIGGDYVGGIAGTNAGEIYGTTGYSMVTHTAIRTGDGYTGGLVGSLDGIAAKLYNCDVSHGVLISFPAAKCGAFAGQLNGVGASDVSHSLFGTSKTGVEKNRIYMGTTDPVRISGNDKKVQLPPPIEQLAGIYPPVPPTHGNLWADYQLWNYLYWEGYQ